MMIITITNIYLLLKHYTISANRQYFFLVLQGKYCNTIFLSSTATLKWRCTIGVIIVALEFSAPPYLSVAVKLESSRCNRPFWTHPDAVAMGPTAGPICWRGSGSHMLTWQWAPLVGPVLLTWSWVPHADAGAGPSTRPISVTWQWVPHVNVVVGPTTVPVLLTWRWDPHADVAVALLLDLFWKKMIFKNGSIIG